MKSIIIIVVLIVILGAAFWLMQKPAMAPNVGTRASPTVTLPSATSTEAVSISGFAFNPADLKIKQGTKVVWTNNDTVSHTVTGDAKVINSPKLAPGASYSFTFTKTGAFKYSCTIHPSMRGTVEVTPLP